MNRSFAIAKRIREVFLDGQWIANTNYKQALQNIIWQQATHKLENLNTIAALTYHINYYLAGLLFAFENGRLAISDKYSFDIPSTFTQTDWMDLITDITSNAEKFATVVQQINDAQLELPFIADQYGSCLRNIEGVIEHSYYHLGQIVLIEKMMVVIIPVKK